jgi:hypothetical protein
MEEYVSPKRPSASNGLCSVTSQKTALVAVTTLRTSSPASSNPIQSNRNQSVILSYLAVLTLLHSPSFGYGISYLKHSSKKKKSLKRKNQVKNFIFTEKKRRKVIKL